MVTILRDARLVLPDAVHEGDLRIAGDRIVGIGEHAADDGVGSGDDRAAAESVELGGDFLLPGLVEAHTDNVERHLLPRPSARWPNALAALLAHDAEVAAAGITTVHDSLRVGNNHGERTPRGELFGTVADVLRRHGAALRVEHRLHLRCELTDPELLATLEPLVDDPGLTLLSLMDHTPGQRQWRDLEALRALKENDGGAEAIEREIDERLQLGQRHVAANRRAVLTRVRARVASGTLTLASHDDTTLEHVEQAAAEGVGIAEFPCTVEAARAARAHGLGTLGGAPNLVRGGSHSGNVAVADLAREGLLGGLSSDYVPASTLQAVFALVESHGWTLPAATALASAAVADMLGLEDRGRIAPGLRADLVRVRLIDGTPSVRAVYVAGERVA